VFLLTKKFAKIQILEFINACEDVVLTFSSKYAETKSDLVNLLNPIPEVGTKKGWDSGNYAQPGSKSV